MKKAVKVKSDAVSKGFPSPNIHRNDSSPETDLNHRLYQRSGDSGYGASILVQEARLLKKYKKNPGEKS